MSTRNRKVTIILSLVLVMSTVGCARSPKATPTQNLNLAYTQAAQTIEAELTRNAPPTIAPQVAAPASATPTLEPLPATSTPLPTNTPLPSNTPLPTATPFPTFTRTPIASPTPTQPQFELAFEDDFSYTGSWAVINAADSTIYSHYTRGGYVIVNKTTNYPIWSVGVTPYADVRVEVTASRLSGPRDGYYGVICRHEDGTHYYLFFVGSDGRYGIAKMMDGILSFLREAKDTTSTVKTGNGVNTIRGDCLGPKLSLWVNGVLMATEKDYDFTAGNVGMGVGTRNTSKMEVFFDNFLVLVPR
jgi:hypothetical protein